jgi:hypothetical protein
MRAASVAELSYDRVSATDAALICTYIDIDIDTDIYISIYVHMRAAYDHMIIQEHIHFDDVYFGEKLEFICMISIQLV